MVLWTLAAVAAPMALDEVFPRAPLTEEQSAQLLTAERIGPPARTYDEHTRGERATTPFQTELAERLDLGELRAPESHQRFAEQVLELSLHGTPSQAHRWFLAEHFGLVGVPEVTLRFYVGDPTAEQIAAQIGPGLEEIEEALPDLRSVAIAVAEEPDPHGGYPGVVTVLTSLARFAPFPRALQPGADPVIPGTLFGAKEQYALYVSQAGREVSVAPFVADGQFDLPVPLPDEPGRYRVVLQRYRKRAFPENPFFLTLYVGVEPPTAWVAGEWGLIGTLAADGATIERQLVRALDEHRAPWGMPPMEVARSARRLREFVANLPEEERKAVRYLEAFGEEDPLTEVPHGSWTWLFGAGFSGEDVAWALVNNPVTRAEALSADYGILGVGSAPMPDGRWRVLGILAERAEASKVTRDRLWDALSEGWSPEPAPELEAGLTRLAGEVAAGAKLGKVLRGVAPLAARLGMTEGYHSWVFQAPTGALPDLSQLQIPAGSKFLAIGHAELPAQSGVRSSVLLVVTSPAAR